MAIVFELTQDPNLLAQYYALREKCFRVELDLPDFDGSEDLQDKRGHILIAHENGVCVAGARISSSWVLPGDVLDEDLAADKSCMWERLVINPEYRSLQLSRDFCAALVDMSRALGYRHALILSSLRNARHYRRCHAAMEVEFEIRKAVPDCAKGKFAGLEHYLSVSHLQEAPALSLAA
jgi:predicted GNAT family N-acyltransferase